MRFYSNQLSHAIKHLFINVCFKYHSPCFICFSTMFAPVISSLDEIYCIFSPGFFHSRILLQFVFVGQYSSIYFSLPATGHWVSNWPVTVNTDIIFIYTQEVNRDLTWCTLGWAQNQLFFWCSDPNNSPIWVHSKRRFLIEKCR